MDLEALEQAIAADRAAGLQPFCVVGTAGTVNTGAIDDLQGIADICEREQSVVPRGWGHWGGGDPGAGGARLCGGPAAERLDGA